MARRFTDAELVERCTCGVPIEQLDGHRSRCPVRARASRQERKRKADPRTAAEIAAQFAAARAYLAGGGRSRE